MLLTALVVLAVLQYRWIREASEGERQRLQNSVQLATSRFAEEFNGEVARALMALIRGSVPGVPGVYGELYLQWRATTAYPQIVRNVFVVETPDAGKLKLLRFDMESKLLKPASWPGDLLDVKDRLTREAVDGPLESFPRERHSGLFLSREPPTAVAPLPLFFGRSVGPQQGEAAEFSIQVGPPPLFAPGPGRPPPSTSSATIGPIRIPPSSWVIVDFATADSAADLFRDRIMAFADQNDFGPRVGMTFAIQARPEPSSLTARPPAGHWNLFVEHRLGSLDAAVDQVRRLNLAVSFGILLVLVGSVVVIIVASERARVLARSQMKFAAAVSHELRTPLAVIQALAYNLTTGVIKDPRHKTHSGAARSKPL